MSIASLAPEYIRAIAPYQPGKPISELAREFGLDEGSIVKLASNENPLGTSPAALAAMQQALAEVARYPDGNGFELKAALAAHYGVETGRIVLGNGSNDILELAAQTFLVAGSDAIYSRHAFAIYALATQARGARGIEVPARDFGHDLSRMLEAVTPETRIVFIANPNNPTGTWADSDTVLNFLRRLPARVLAVLDEAYDEYLPEEQKSRSIAWLRKFPNLLVVRTFSKVYGLAGARVGFGLAHPEVADLMNRVRQPFNVSNVAQAGAIAALGDRNFVRESFLVNQRGMAQLTRGLDGLGLSFIPSAGNFVTFRAPDAAGVFQRLLRLGVIVRPIAGYGLPDYLRVTVGLEEENARFLEALAQALRGAS